MLREEEQRHVIGSHVEKMQGQATEWEKIFAACITNTTLQISKKNGQPQRKWIET